jgi:5-formyltetrahydrofolate cyclo-ligase
MNPFKSQWRTIYIQKRKEIPEARRLEAAAAALDALDALLKKPSIIVSFASMRQEINLWPFNDLLVKQQRLALPKIVGDELQLFTVTNFDDDLELSPWNILEPNLKKCRPIAFKNISCILVPALAYDPLHMRLGYGKGHYDRLLKHIPQPKLGVGFKEQLSLQPLPIEDHDRRLDELHLF